MDIKTLIKKKSISLKRRGYLEVFPYRPTDGFSDELQELLGLLFATKNRKENVENSVWINQKVLSVTPL